MENFKAVVWAKDNLVNNLQVLDRIISDRCVCYYYWTVTALGN